MFVGPVTAVSRQQEGLTHQWVSMGCVSQEAVAWVVVVGEVAVVPEDQLSICLLLCK